MTLDALRRGQIATALAGLMRGFGCVSPRRRRPIEAPRLHGKYSDGLVAA